MKQELSASTEEIEVSGWLTPPEGTAVARCTVARLMRAMGLQGAVVVRGKPARTCTISDRAAPCPLDRRQSAVPGAAPRTCSGSPISTYVCDLVRLRLRGLR